MRIGAIQLVHITVVTVGNLRYASRYCITQIWLYSTRSIGEQGPTTGTQPPDAHVEQEQQQVTQH